MRAKLILIHKMGENTSTPSLQITSLTYDIDTPGLFDYASPNIFKQILKVKNSASVGTLNGELVITEADNQTSLLKLKKKGEHYILKSDLLETQALGHEKVWLVVNMLKSPLTPARYRLSEGEVLRLGRAIVRVKEMKTDSLNKHSNRLVASSRLLSGNLQGKADFFGRGYSKHLQAANALDQLPDTDLCRVCYSGHYTTDDPLVSICKCAGSLQYMHINCLRSWIASRAEITVKGPVVTYEWKKHECEVCMTEYPVNVKIDNQTYELLTIYRPHTNYMLLEEITRQQDSSYSVFCIELTQASIFCGRSHDCHLRVKDISVSRKHATLHLEKNAAYIEDNNSKFGTLALVNRAISIQSGSEVPLQVDKTVLLITADYPRQSERPAISEVSRRAEKPRALPEPL